MKKDLKDFNPKEVAAAELHMWQSYYTHKFIKLFFQLLHFHQLFFGFTPIRSLLAAYHSAYAATIFRRRKGRETEDDKKSIQKELTLFYKIISKHSTRPFDFERVAQLEMYWWFVDRYPDRYSTTREYAIAECMAAIYGITKENCLEYAQLRARAMVLQDEFEQGDVQEVDWKEIGRLLAMSYQSLHKAVH